MDLLGKVGTAAVILVVLFSIILFVSAPRAATSLNKTQAVKAVLNDVQSTSPGSTVSVISAANSSVAQNSWQIVLSVVYNGTRPCPTMMIEGFDYPATGFVPTQSNLYTRGCIVYGLSSAPSYVISSPIIAIASSYNSMNSAIVAYVAQNGYNNVMVTAKFYSALASSATPLNMSYSNVWLVNYTAPHSLFNQYAVLDQSGNVKATYTH